MTCASLSTYDIYIWLINTVSICQICCLYTHTLIERNVLTKRVHWVMCFSDFSSRAGINSGLFAHRNGMQVCLSIHQCYFMIYITRKMVPWVICYLNLFRVHWIMYLFLLLHCCFGGLCTDYISLLQDCFNDPTQVSAITYIGKGFVRVYWDMTFSK